MGKKIKVYYVSVRKRHCLPSEKPEIEDIPYLHTSESIKELEKTHDIIKQTLAGHIEDFPNQDDTMTQVRLSI